MFINYLQFIGQSFEMLLDLKKCDKTHLITRSCDSRKQIIIEM